MHRHVAVPSFTHIRTSLSHEAMKGTSTRSLPNAQWSHYSHILSIFPLPNSKFTQNQMLSKRRRPCNTHTKLPWEIICLSPQPTTNVLLAGKAHSVNPAMLVTQARSMERRQQARVVQAARELEKQEALQNQVDMKASKMMHLAATEKAQMRAAAIAKAAAAERQAKAAEQKAAQARADVQKLGANNDKFLDLNPPTIPPKQRDPYSNLDPPVYKAKSDEKPAAGVPKQQAKVTQKAQVHDPKVRGAHDIV
jgi:hypothetical protein